MVQSEVLHVCVDLRLTSEFHYPHNFSAKLKTETTLIITLKLSVWGLGGQLCIWLYWVIKELCMLSAEMFEELRQLDIYLAELHKWVWLGQYVCVHSIYNSMTCWCTTWPADGREVFHAHWVTHLLLTLIPGIRPSEVNRMLISSRARLRWVLHRSHTVCHSYHQFSVDGFRL